MIRNFQRYTIAVFIGYAFDFIAFSIIVFFSYDPYAANIIGFFIGTVINVFLIRNFVFQSHRFNATLDLLLTLASNSTVLFLSLGFLFLMVDVLCVNIYLSKLVTNLATLCTNYCIRTALFRGG